MWQKDFAIERSIDEKVCVDKDNKPIPWYTYPAIEYLSQFDYSDKEIFEFGCGYSSMFWANRAKQVTSIEDNPNWFDKWKSEFNKENLDIRWRDEGEGYFNAIFELCSRIAISRHQSIAVKKKKKERKIDLLLISKYAAK